MKNHKKKTLIFLSLTHSLSLSLSLSLYRYPRSISFSFLSLLLLIEIESKRRNSLFLLLHVFWESLSPSFSMLPPRACSGLCRSFLCRISVLQRVGGIVFLHSDQKQTQTLACRSDLEGHNQFVSSWWFAYQHKDIISSY